MHKLISLVPVRTIWQPHYAAKYAGKKEPTAAQRKWIPLICHYKLKATAEGVLIITTILSCQIRGVEPVRNKLMDGSRKSSYLP